MTLETIQQHKAQLRTILDAVKFTPGKDPASLRAAFRDTIDNDLYGKEQFVPHVEYLITSVVDEFFPFAGRDTPTLMENHIEAFLKSPISQNILQFENHMVHVWRSQPTSVPEEDMQQLINGLDWLGMHLFREQWSALKKYRKEGGKITASTSSDEFDEENIFHVDDGSGETQQVAYVLQNEPLTAFPSVAIQGEITNSKGITASEAGRDIVTSGALPVIEKDTTPPPIRRELTINDLLPPEFGNDSILTQLDRKAYKNRTKVFVDKRGRGIILTKMKTRYNKDVLRALVPGETSLIAAEFQDVTEEDVMALLHGAAFVGESIVYYLQAIKAQRENVINNLIYEKEHEVDWSRFGQVSLLGVKIPIYRDKRKQVEETAVEENRIYQTASNEGADTIVAQLRELFESSAAGEIIVEDDEYELLPQFVDLIEELVFPFTDASFSIPDSSQVRALQLDVDVKERPRLDAPRVPTISDPVRQCLEKYSQYADINQGFALAALNVTKRLLLLCEAGSPLDNEYTKGRDSFISEEDFLALEKEINEYVLTSSALALQTEEREDLLNSSADTKDTNQVVSRRASRGVKALELISIES